MSGQFLYVGVPQLPVTFSPATATTDTEHQALDLLFESLVRPTYSDKYGQRYVLNLAAQQPRMIPLGRQFAIRRDIFWSNGDHLSGADVRQTVLMLIGSGQANLLRSARMTGVDNYELDIKLKQGYIDPLALMSFKVLPAGVHDLRDPGFARGPIGSGPFRLKSPSSADEVVFEANPYYAGRRGGSGYRASSRFTSLSRTIIAAISWSRLRAQDTKWICCSVFPRTMSRRSARSNQPFTCGRYPTAGFTSSQSTTAGRRCKTWSCESSSPMPSTARTFSTASSAIPTAR